MQFGIKPWFLCILGHWRLLFINKLASSSWENWLSGTQEVMFLILPEEEHNNWIVSMRWDCHRGWTDRNKCFTCAIWSDIPSNWTHGSCQLVQRGLEWRWFGETDSTVPAQMKHKNYEIYTIWDKGIYQENLKGPTCNFMWKVVQVCLSACISVCVCVWREHTPMQCTLHLPL